MPTLKEIMAGLLSDDGPHPPVARLIGFRMRSAEAGTATFTLHADERHHNPMGTLHGGILCDLADAAMGMAFASTLEEGETFTTLELKANYLRPVREADLTATARVVHRGSTVGMVECAVTDEQGRLVAKLSSTCTVLRGSAAGGRKIGDWQ